VAAGHFAVAFPRTDYWQIAYVIPKGADAQVRALGLAAFQRSVAELLPQYADRVAELDDWSSVKLLRVRSDRLRQWYRSGYLAIGDAAHAMSPVGGVGINVAIQDAVVAANLLWQPLRQRRVSTYTLRRVQRRRELPVRLIQGVQAFIQDRVFEPALTAGSTVKLPLAVQLLTQLPVLRVLPARLIAYGLTRPRVRTPAPMRTRSTIAAA